MYVYVIYIWVYFLCVYIKKLNLSFYNLVFTSSNLNSSFPSPKLFYLLSSLSYVMLLSYSLVHPTRKPLQVLFFTQSFCPICHKTVDFTSTVLSLRSIPYTSLLISDIILSFGVEKWSISCHNSKQRLSHEGSPTKSQSSAILAFHV